MRQLNLHRHLQAGQPRCEFAQFLERDPVAMKADGFKRRPEGAIRMAVNAIASYARRAIHHAVVIVDIECPLI